MEVCKVYKNVLGCYCDDDDYVDNSTNMIVYLNSFLYNSFLGVVIFDLHLNVPLVSVIIVK